MNITLSQEQTDAINSIKRWYNDPNSPQVFRFFGYAGTGKTTIIKEFTKGLSKVKFAAYTAKAASVMRKKGSPGAQTIHSMIYQNTGDSAAQKLAENAENIAKCKDPAQLLILEQERAKLLKIPAMGDSWSLLDELPDVELIVLDECSMINDDMADDLLSFGIKILVVGDPGQLPPLKGSGKFIQEKPDVLLTEIHRQASDNPIIALSFQVRNDRKVPNVGMYGDSSVHSLNIPKPERDRLVLGSDKVICRFNKTRVQQNMMKRTALNLPTTEPVVGDYIMCWKNNRNIGLINGGEYKITKLSVIEEGKDAGWYEMEVLEDGNPVPIVLPRVHPYRFQGFLYSENMRSANLQHPVLGQKYVDALPISKRNDIVLAMTRAGVQMEFSHAITCHKAQGSQWKQVYVINETYSNGQFDERWLYTAVTRAEETVHIRV